MDEKWTWEEGGKKRPNMFGRPLYTVPNRIELVTRDGSLASDFRGVDKQLQDFENLTIAEEPRTEHLDAEAEQLKTPKSGQ